MTTHHIWIHGKLATMAPGRPGLGEVEDGGVVCENGRILWVGAMSDFPTELEPLRDRVPVTDLEGRWVTPGLVDCHTHLLYAGTRAQEFRARQAGATYEEIARSGGGILSTVRATRAADRAELIRQTQPRMDALMDEGVTTVEIKSGYGLDVETELRCLNAIRLLGTLRRVEVVPTFLGAHAVPPEFLGKDAQEGEVAPSTQQAGEVGQTPSDRYMDHVIQEQLPRVAQEGVARAVDAFCEGIAFSPPQIRRLFAAAREHGLPVKLHAEQLSHLGGAQVAAEFGALSADHLEYLDGDGVAALASAGTVAVLLPGAFYYLRETQQPPVKALREAGVPMALATDSNPGSSPVTSPLLVMNMGAVLFGLTVEECLLGVTRNGAQALGMLDELGTLEVGKRCDLAIWDVEALEQLVYRMGMNPLHARVWKGEM
ncbi:MAG: imidazolonepropionase [Gemmatimonadota bacterium]